MKHVSIIVPEGHAVIDTVIAPYNLLRMANAYCKRSSENEEDLMKIDLVGLSREPVIYDSHFQVTPTTSIDEIDHTDLIIVAANSGDLSTAIELNRRFIPWIRQQRIENDTEIASLCKGAALLAETGLLNGKTCATHWTIHDFFNQRYPKVNLVPDGIICEDRGIYSSGGAYSFLNFTLYLIEKYFGREIAIQTSKVSEIEMDRTGQGHFMIFNGQKNHEDQAIMTAQSHIEKHVHEKLSMEELAEMVNLSKRSFLRRFKKATANTPLEYVQRVKIEAVKRQLESTASSIQESMFSVGYNDEKAFRNTFKKFTGLSPMQYRNKYNREMARA